MKRLPLLTLIIFTVINFSILFAKDEENQIIYFQMEPVDDSLFIKIQENLFIDPLDPTAEIVIDLRDNANRTISVKGALYPIHAPNNELRSKIITYPFKINLEKTINYGSVYTQVIDKLRYRKIINPPSAFQISPALGYINPFLQFMGGE